jgi:hypothetical protein
MRKNITMTLKYTKKRESVCVGDAKSTNANNARICKLFKGLICRSTNKMFTNIRNLALDKKMKVPWPKKVALQLDPQKKREEQEESAKLTQRKNSTKRENCYSTEAWERVCEREKERECVCERERKRERESGKSTNRKPRNNAKREGARKTATEECR